MTAERTADLSARIGEPLGETPWMRISQQNINRFGELTGDTQWIHTDPYRAPMVRPPGLPGLWGA